jgi:3',5'-cyclic-AMP phosphodiesterase
MTRIAHITDIHIEHQFPKQHGVDAIQNWELLLADVKKRKVDFLVFGGDIGETSMFPYFFESLNRIGIPYHLVLGNHDKYAEVKSHLKLNNSLNENELFYTFQDDDHQFFVLDSSIGKLSNLQQDWFLSELAQTHLMPVVFVHHPFLPFSTRVDIDFPLLKRKSLVKKIKKINHQVVLICGHYHTDSHIIQNNINQYVTPSGAFQILQNTDTIQVDPNDFGYRLIQIEKGQVLTEIIRFFL